MATAVHRSLILPSRAASLAVARRFVDDYLRKAGFSDAARAEIVLAVNEAVCNAIRYGSPAGEADQVELDLVMEGTCLIATVRDHGPPIPSPTPSLPDPRSFAGHGRGVFLMHRLMDNVLYRWDGGTIVRMTRQKRP